ERAIQEVHAARRQNESHGEPRVHGTLPIDDKGRRKCQQWERRLRFDEPPQVMRRIRRHDGETKQPSERAVSRTQWTAVESCVEPQHGKRKWQHRDRKRHCLAPVDPKNEQAGNRSERKQIGSYEKRETTAEAGGD